MMFDTQYLLFMIPGILLALYAQFRLSSTYGHYSQVSTSRGLTGAHAAREILDGSGLHNVDIHEVGGHLTDHYDPGKRALFLSSDNFHGNTIAAVGVAAHEAGHALQHAAAYAPLHLRMAMVPITNFASTAVYGMMVASYIMHISKLAWIGLIAFSVITLFQLITLPVEFDASRRAKAQLSRLGIIDARESSGVSKVLGAAALTYVAAMIQGLVQLLYFFMLARGNNRN